MAGTEGVETSGARGGKLDVKRVRLGIGVLLVIAAVVIGIALLGGDSSSETSASESNAVALSAPELLAKASELSGPSFWVGPRAGTASYELSSTPDGRHYIRYLTGDAEAGDPRPDFLTVGTYPVPEALQALQTAAKEGGGSQTLSTHNGYKVLSSADATNAYIVFDDEPDLQVEIFSPQPGEAAKLATAGALATID